VLNGFPRLFAPAILKGLRRRLVAFLHFGLRTRFLRKRRILGHCPPGSQAQCQCRNHTSFFHGFISFIIVILPKSF
jgi:hypothetical protein